MPTTIGQVTGGTMRHLLLKISIGFAMLLGLISPSFAWDSGAGCSSGQYDMLGWMTPSNGVWANHLSGPFSPGGGTDYMWSDVNSGYIFQVKAAAGWPWDINTYDANGVYLFETGYSFTDETLLGLFDHTSGVETGVKMFTRCVNGGYPGYVATIANPYQQVTPGGGNCTLGTPTQSGYIRNSVWGPYSLSLGGSLPNNNPTLVFAYERGCASDYSYCAAKEEQYYQEGYGWVMWRLWNWNGSSYVLAQEADFNSQSSSPSFAFSNTCGH